MVDEGLSRRRLEGKRKEEFGPRKAVSMRGVRALRSVADSLRGDQPMLVPDSEVIKSLADGVRRLPPCVRRA